MKLVHFAKRDEALLPYAWITIASDWRTVRTATRTHFYDWRFQWPITVFASGKFGEELHMNGEPNVTRSYPPRCPKCGEIVGKCSHYEWRKSP